MRKWLFVLTFVAVAAGATAFWAIAARNDAQVATITGCLKEGNLRSFAIGDSPSKPCRQGETQVQLSGGDITQVATPLGGGLEGGADNGAAIVSLQQRFRLPQDCSAGDVIRYSSALQYWTCGARESAAYQVFRRSVKMTINAVGGRGQKVLTLHLPPGTYAVSTALWVHKPSGSGVLICLTHEEPGDAIRVVQIQTMGSEPGDVLQTTLGATGIGTVGTNGTFELWCQQGAGATGLPPVVDVAGITAVSVASATVTEDTSSDSQYGP